MKALASRRHPDSSLFNSLIDYVPLLQRILQVDYEIPPQVKTTKECRNILSRILVAQPGKRITIPEIQRHPWYLKDLPPGVVDMNDHLPPVSANAQVGNPTLHCWSKAVLA